MKLLFKVPVIIKPDVAIEKFDNRNDVVQYILSTSGRYFLINKTLFNLIKVIQKNDDLLRIKHEFGKIQNTKYSENEIITAINELLVPKNVVETLKVQNIKSSKSFLSYKKPIFSREFLHPITNILQIFFHPNVAKITISLIVLSHLFIIYLI